MGQQLFCDSLQVPKPAGEKTLVRNKLVHVSLSNKEYFLLLSKKKIKNIFFCKGKSENRYYDDISFLSLDCFINIGRLNEMY